MKIHLIRSEEIPVRRFAIILKMLKEFKGPVEFVAKEEGIMNLQDLNYVYSDLDYNITVDEKLSWNELFGKCEKHRKSLGIQPNEAVVLLTDHGNDEYWFSSWEPSGRLNFFVQTSGWEHFIDAESCYPIIYEIASIALALAFSKNLKELEDMAHHIPRGCMFDFCQDKKDVQWRIRTGDICPDCLDAMIQKNINPALARQIFDIIEWVRKQVMFRERFKITKRPSRIEIDFKKRILIFLDLGNITVHLRPQEMIIYRLFMNHVNGIYLSQVIEKSYTDKLYKYYSDYTKKENIAAVYNGVVKVADNSKDKLSQTISKIKKAITDAIGAEMAEYYIIKSETGTKHKIQLDKSLLVNYSDKII